MTLPVDLPLPWVDPRDVGDVEDLRAALRGAGLGERQVEAMVGMSVGVRENFVAADPRTVRTTTPTTLRAWAHDHM